MTNHINSTSVVGSTICTSSALFHFNDDHCKAITKNLSSLQFDAGVGEPGRRLLFLRKRSQLVTINIVSHAVFTCAMLGEIKRNACKLRNDHSQLKVGLIGCGRLGTHLIHALLYYTNILADDIKVSTRRPDAVFLDHGLEGVTCFHDNMKASVDVDILFLCCPPHQIAKVLKEVKTAGLQPHCLVYSIVSGISSKKISEIIEHDLVLKPSYSYKEEIYLSEDEWNYTGDVVSSLAMNTFKHLTCPLQLEESEDSVVQVDEVFLKSLFLHMLNVCMYYEADLHVEKSIELSNNILFRGMVGFSLDGIAHMEKSFSNDQGYFKINDLNVDSKDMILERSYEFVKNFKKHYKMIFDSFTDWTVF